ncbi:hypothetical protein HNP29_001148 [Pseudomonas alcaligenes]|uniref:hypothetical protein n=1 Tax=Pseudomonas sp. PDM13 TaxID=2769255 RepID=UPI00160758B4|nr:hypothetical protein [Pseudomonas sp. PDM13]MBB4817791.1 hypothetical protein [Pseudomonas alcaligenes]MCU9947109.1 hypothetical protein [Pseudomonas sp. PDM13]
MNDPRQAPLMLRQDIERNADELQYREQGLSLSEDGLALVLSYYFENYRPGYDVRVVCSYQVPLAEFTRWMIDSGRLRLYQP